MCSYIFELSLCLIIVCKISPPVINNVNIDKLCVQDGKNSWKYPIIAEAAPVAPVLIQFAILTSQKFENDIFHQHYKAEVKKLASTSSWPEIKDALKAALDFCFHILERIKNQTITLHDVDLIFCKKTTVGLISQDISRLHNAFSLPQEKLNLLCVADNFSKQKAPCDVSGILTAQIESSSNQSDTTWIKEISSEIFLWRGLTPFLKEAKEFTNILKELEVDPSDVKAFSEIVSTSKCAC